MDKKPLWPMLAAVAIFAIGAAHAWADDDAGGAKTPSTVFVKTEALVQKTLPVEITSYGMIQPDIANTLHVVMSRPGQVTRLAVSPGQEVRRGQRLFEFATSAAVLSGYRQAASAVTFARADLARSRELLKERLATNAQVAAAEKALSDAQQALQAQEQIGAGRPTEWVVSPADAVVTEVTAKVGDRMDQGGAVLQLTTGTAVQAVLGIQPEQVAQVRSGMPVAITSVFADKQVVNGRIGDIHRVINPQTRLVDAVVRLDEKTAHGLLPGMNVKGVITVAALKSWVVPRQAVLTDEGGAYVFQIKDGKAVRVDVQIVLDAQDSYGISGKLDPAEKLVTLGNYELSDGQAVRETEAVAKDAAGKAGDAK